ncbi:MAG: DHHW family protein [Lachnospiraceae bacterium]|nr:DHHW family protein [Lachnospiraceae bacterium]
MNQRPETKTEQDKLLELQFRVADEKPTKTADLIAVAAFLLIVFGFCIAGWLLPDRTFSPDENRDLTQLPSLEKDGKPFGNLFEGNFTSQFTDYLSDQFPLRDSFVGLKAAAELALGKHENEDKVLGKNGRIYEREDYPSTENLKTNLSHIAAFTGWASGQGIPVILAPTGRAQDVIPEDLPALYPASLSDEIWETFGEEAGKIPSLTYIDLRAALIAKKTAGENLYYRTDHHWTTLGAYYAYDALGSALSYTPYPVTDYSGEGIPDFRGTYWSGSGMKWIGGEEIDRFRYPGDTDFTTVSPAEGTFSGFYVEKYFGEKDKYAGFFGSNTGLVTVRKNGEEDRPCILVVKDSFAHSLAPFLARHFDLDLLDLRYYSQSTVKALCEKNGYDAVLILGNLDLFTDDPATTRFALLSAGC